MLEVISVHVPKCAGISFRVALQNAYTPEAVFLSYDDNPGNPISATSLDPDGASERAEQAHAALPAGIRALHGHFHVNKFRYVDRAVRRITVLRHPVERTISHYHYFRQPHAAGHPIRDYMLKHHLSLLQFALLPRIRFFYSQTFFGGVSRSDFDFVGSIETLETWTQDLSALIGCSFAISVNNVGWLRASSPDMDASMQAELAKVLDADIAFYHAWTRPQGLRDPGRGSNSGYT